jgi:hypothetical protein
VNFLKNSGYFYLKFGLNWLILNKIYLNFGDKEKKMQKISRVDRQILGVLQTDATISTGDLAEQRHSRTGGAAGSAAIGNRGGGICDSQPHTSRAAKFARV